MNSLRNSKDTYGSVAKFLHWTIAFLIIMMLIMGNIFNEFPKEIRPDVYMFHKSTGILILALVAFRIFWRVTNLQPELPAGYDKKIVVGAKFAHLALYALMIAIPLSGWLFASPKYPFSFYGLFDIPHLTGPDDKNIRNLANDAHEFFANGLIALIMLHLAAAIYHHRILKDNVLTRMLPSCRGKCKK